MGAIPTSTIPGHQRLHKRVCDTLDRCQENQAAELKESGDWNSLKWHITRTIMAMANLRDGGIVIIGASERDGTWTLTGITPAHLATYDVDTVIDFVHKYSSTPLVIDIVLVPYDEDRSFLAIRVGEFEKAPCVCKKNAPDGNDAFRRADTLIRPPGTPRTKRVEESGELEDLLELAAEKRARELIASGHRIGLVTKIADKEKFDSELDGL